MVLSLNEMRIRSEEFIEEYEDISDEHSYAQHFWRDFFHDNHKFKKKEVMKSII